MRELDNNELEHISGGRAYRGRDERQSLTPESKTSAPSPIQLFQQFNSERERRERSRYQLDTNLLSRDRFGYRPATLSYKTPYLNR